MHLINSQGLFSAGTCAFFLRGFGSLEADSSFIEMAAVTAGYAGYQKSGGVLHAVLQQSLAWF